MATQVQDLQDKIKKLDARIKTLTGARDQLSKEWLDVERGKSILMAAIENLQLGFVAMDDYKNIILKNEAADNIVGKLKNSKWTIDDLGQSITEGDYLEEYGLIFEIDKCYREKIRIGPVDVRMYGKKVRLFLSPIIVLKKSITVPGVVLVMEELS